MSLSQDVSSDTSLNICVVDFDPTTTYMPLSGGGRACISGCQHLYSKVGSDSLSWLQRVNNKHSLYHFATGPTLLNFNDYRGRAVSSFDLFQIHIK